MNDDTVKATTYLQVVPVKYNGERITPAVKAHVNGARTVRATQKRSTSPEPGSIEVKITVELPKSAFLPLAPEAHIVIPEGLTIAHPIEVEAHDPSEGS